LVNRNLEKERVKETAVCNSYKSSDFSIEADCRLPLASDKQFCWMAVNTPGAAPFCKAAFWKNTLKASQANDPVPKGVNDRRGNNVEEFWGC